MARKKSVGGAAAAGAEGAGVGVAEPVEQPAPAPAPEAPPPVDADARRALLLAQPLPKGLLGRMARCVLRSPHRPPAAVPPALLSSASPLTLPTPRHNQLLAPHLRVAELHSGYVSALHLRVTRPESLTRSLPGFYMLDRFEQVLMAFSFVVFCYAVLLGLHAAVFAIVSGLSELAGTLKTR